MPQRITPGQIKKNNRQQIYNFIYENERVSQQDIAYALKLSRPTVTANLAALEEDGLIARAGTQDSDQIGRKAIAYSVVSDFRIAVGVEILRRQAKLIAIDLYGRKIERRVENMPYANETAYYEALCEIINQFIDALPQPNDRVLGIGISMQGLASPDGRAIVYGKILGCTDARIEAFENSLNYPCRFIHDPKGAALSELWASPELTDAVYISLSRHLGGALISHRQVMPGKHGHNAVIEHMQAVPNGPVCYCGQRGCWDTVCSMRALMGNQDQDSFFAAARTEHTPEAARWQVYLKNLARLIGSLHLMHDVDIILGGHLAPCFNDDDIRFLYSEIRRNCPFDEADDFIRMSKMPSHNITIGIALPYIRSFLDDIDSPAN